MQFNIVICVELTQCTLVPYTTVSAPKCPQSAVADPGFSQGGLRNLWLVFVNGIVKLREASHRLAEGLKHFYVAICILLLF